MKATYMISVVTSSGQVGAVLVVVDDTPEVQAMRIDDDGEDIKLMGIGCWHDRESMVKLGY